MCVGQQVRHYRTAITDMQQRVRPIAIFVEYISKLYRPWAHYNSALHARKLITGTNSAYLYHWPTQAKIRIEFRN